MRDPRPAAHEILFRIDRLMRFDETVDLSYHSPDRDIVERCVEVLSEASRRLPAEFKARHPEIPWQSIADIGNIIRHGYDSVAEPPLREVISTHLQPLKQVIMIFLAEIDTE